MNKEQLEARIKEIQTAIDQSAANHNSLVGRLHEAQHLLNMMDVCHLSDVEMVDQAQVEE